MKVLNCYSEKDFRLEDAKKPEISDGEMLIEMLYCGLCGSDIIKIFDPMLKKPDVYGHEVVGKVVEIGKEVKNFKIGDTIIAAHHIPCGSCHFCRHGNHTMCSHFKETNIYPGGFSQFIRLSQDHVDNTVFELPEGFDPLRALFIEPLACCIRAMNRIDRLPEDIFSITGAGAIGILFLLLLKFENLKAVVIDTDDDRLGLAAKLGADLIINPAEKSMQHDNKVPEKIKKMFPLGIDAAILTVTNQHTISDALSYIRPGGSINIFGMSEKDGIMPLDFGKVYKNELTIKSTYSATPDTLARAYYMITSGQIDVSPLISGVLSLSEFKKGLDMMLSRKIYKAFYRL
jgi:L-iditol 2-dehydrogenase